jgi:protein TonB
VDAWTLIAALLAQVAAPTAKPPAGGDWTYFEGDATGDYFLESAKPGTESGVVRFRLRQRAPESATALFHTAIISLRIDCRAQTIAMESSATYDVSGATLSTENVPEAWLDNDPIYSGSVMERLYLRQCPASLRRPLGVRPPPPPVMIMPPPIQRTIPIAPPAPPPPPPPPPLPADYPVERTRPILPLGSLVTADDYPAAALRAGEEGVVRYRLTVNRDGRVSQCVVTASSGSASLDGTTCRIMTARARFTPARTAKGKRTEDQLAGAVRWQIPDEPVTAPEPIPTPESPQ